MNFFCMRWGDRICSAPEKLDRWGQLGDYRPFTTNATLDGRAQGQRFLAFKVADCKKRKEKTRIVVNDSIF